MKRLLIVEDDIALASGVAMALKSSDLEVTVSNSLREAREKLKSGSFELVLLDINLPDGSGLDYLQEIKSSCPSKVILLTANDMEINIVSGLELGADDYITKPFSLAVLRARVNTQLRDTASQRIVTDGFIFDFDKMKFFKGDNRIELSKTEQKLLKLLIDNRGITLTRDTLLDRIWTDGADYVDENALSVTVKRLRDKLENCPSKPKYIKTIYGIGYSWAVK